MLHQEWHYMQLNLNYTKNYPMNYSVSSTQIKLAEKKNSSDLLDLLGMEGETVELQFMLKL